VKLNAQGVGQVPHGWDGMLSLLGGRSANALGHLINHPPEGVAAQVKFVFVPMPTDAPEELLRRLPSVNARPDRERRWAIAVIARRDSGIFVTERSESSELYIDYGRDPTTLGWQGPVDM